MANCCIILGKSGSGKSTSIKGLNPKETLILSVLGKKLPFRGSSNMYILNKNLYRVNTYTEVIDKLLSADKVAAIKNIVIDDAIFIMTKEFFKRAKETGFTKFTEFGQHFQQIMGTYEDLRDDLNIFIILHSEDIVNDKAIVGQKIRTIGNLLDEKYNPMETVPMLLFCKPKFDGKGNPEFGFYTKTCIEGTIEIPAKTPEGMFEDLWIPNDLGIVVNAIDSYYNNK